MRKLFDILRNPLIENANLDSYERFKIHKNALENKRMLREVFTEFHNIFHQLDQKFFTATGLRIELGAGIKPMEIPRLGPMNGANQALNYIVFKRDRQALAKKYPNLKIIHTDLYNNYLKYIVSRGLSFKQLLPVFMVQPVSLLQILLFPLRYLLPLHHVIVIKKI